MTPEEFLNYVYNLDYSNVEEDNELIRLLGDLPHQKVIFTNATRKYAEELLGRMGVLHFFDAIVDIYDTKFESKPNESAFSHVMSSWKDIAYEDAVLIDDRWQNLKTASELGMGTILCRGVHEEHHSFPDIYKILDYLRRG